MASYSVCAVGVDKPGILAAISRRLLAHDADVIETQLAILRGTMMLTLLVDAPDDLDPFALDAELRQDATTLGLAECSLAELPAVDLGTMPRSPSHIVSFYGPPRRGALAGLAGALAGHAIDVVELQSRLMPPSAGDAEALSVLLMEVAPPPGMADDELAALLRAIARDERLEIALAALESAT